MKPLVIYHANCADGFGAAFAAWLKFGDDAEYVPMDYGNISTPEDFDMKVSLAAKGNEVYILDFSFPRDVMDALFRHTKRVVWLDHHKTAFEMWCGKAPDLFFTIHKEVDDQKHIVLDDCKSGAMLAWEYFHPGTKVPMLIQHIDDRDRWQFKLEGSKEIHAALASHQPWSFEQWQEWGLHVPGKTSFYREMMIHSGTAILRAHNQNVQAVLKQARECFVRHDLDPVFGGTTLWDGLAANAPAHLASDLGHELANKSGTFGLVWSVAGDLSVHCSLRSNGDYDVSAIAKAFGGGGHRNAAGFSTNIDTLMGWLK